MRYLLNLKKDESKLKVNFKNKFVFGYFLI